jgi:hypothetical protein
VKQDHFMAHLWSSWKLRSMRHVFQDPMLCISTTVYKLNGIGGSESREEEMCQSESTQDLLLKVRKRENFVGSDFEFFTFFAFKMFKY